jgi:hypothetical protein
MISFIFGNEIDFNGEEIFDRDGFGSLTKKSVQILEATPIFDKETIGSVEPVVENKTKTERELILELVIAEKEDAKEAMSRRPAPSAQIEPRKQNSVSRLGEWIRSSFNRLRTKCGPRAFAPRQWGEVARKWGQDALDWGEKFVFPPSTHQEEPLRPNPVVIL